MKKTIISIAILAFFFIAAVGSGSSSSTTSSSSSRSSDAYSSPSRSEVCYACGGRGYIMRNGVKETCVCGGSGKSTSFPN